MPVEVTRNNQTMTWGTHVPEQTRRMEPRRLYWGTVVLDVDGTLTAPGHDYKIDTGVFPVLETFLKGGGHIVICTGATRGRLERTFLTPLYNHLSEQSAPADINEMLRRFIMQPENGSALLLPRGGARMVENETVYDWYRLHELPVPNKPELKSLLTELLSDYKGAYVVADDYHDPTLRREYMLSVKDTGNSIAFQKLIEQRIAPQHPEIDWKNIRIKAARTTVDFVHAESGKAVSIPWLLNEVEGFSGPIIGFGDLGDEFATVVPTINVNRYDPNAFRLRDQPAMDVCGSWELLNNQGYVTIGEGPNTKILDRKTGKEIPILRNADGTVIYAEENSDPEKNGLFAASDHGHGHPVRIMPLTYQKDGKIVEVQDAGNATAYMVKRLMEVGYFS